MPRIDPRRLVVITDRASNGHVPLPGHHGGHVDGEVEQARFGRINDVGEDGVEDPRVGQLEVLPERGQTRADDEDGFGEEQNGQQTVEDALQPFGEQDGQRQAIDEQADCAQRVLRHPVEPPRNVDERGQLFEGGASVSAVEILFQVLEHVVEDQRRRQVGRHHEVERGGGGIVGGRPHAVGHHQMPHVQSRRRSGMISGVFAAE